MSTKPTSTACLLIVVLEATTAGCATLFNDGQRTVSFNSTPGQAEIWIDGTRRGVTPYSLDLNNHRDHTVTFRKDGHQDVICEITASVGAGWVILDVLGGVASRDRGCRYGELEELGPWCVQRQSADRPL